MFPFILLSGCFWNKTQSSETFGETLPQIEDQPKVDAELTSSGPITCENPTNREQSPMTLADFGEAWSSQPVEGYTPLPEHVVGGEGVAVGDFNQDGKLDIFVPTIDVDLFFIQQENGAFIETSTDSFPQREPSTTLGASAVDFDGDHDLDLFVLNVDTPHQLFENQGEGTFVDISIDMDIVQTRYDSFGATWGDSDHDGDLDLLVLNTGYGPLDAPPWDDFENFEASGPNVLYKYEFGQAYTIEPLPNHTPEPYSCCAAFVDVNLDLVQDLYIVNDFGMYVQPNQLFHGDESGAFTPHVDSGLDVGMYGMGLAVGDLNNDQYPDFAVTDWGRNWLFLSDGFGQWYDNTLGSNFVAGLDSQQVGWGVEVHDFDNDADLDIWVGYGYLNMPEEEQESFDEFGLFNPKLQPDALFMQEAGVFSDVAEEWGINRSTITRGGVWADLNDDGFLDFISTAIDGPVEAYLANCDDSNWLRVKLHQPLTLNTDAVGARVKITSAGSSQVRWILAGTSLSSSGPLEAHFGLGASEQIDHLQILWPDRRVSNFYNVDSNQILDVTRTE